MQQAESAARALRESQKQEEADRARQEAPVAASVVNFQKALLQKSVDEKVKHLDCIRRHREAEEAIAAEEALRKAGVLRSGRLL